MLHRAFAIILLSCLVCAANRAQAGDTWPQFRGPTGQGFTTEANLPVTWGGTNNENVFWKSPLVGEGHASPIIWKDRVLVCTVFWPASVKEPEKVFPEHHLLCYALSDGRLVWDIQIPHGPWLRSDFRSGPGGGYACPTPTTDGRLVYCVFGSAVIAAVDFQGRIAWRKEIVPYTFDVTIGTSPILYRDTVLMFCPSATKSDSRLIAYDMSNGNVAWQAKFPKMGFGHSTPLVIEVQGREQLLVLSSGGEDSPEALLSLDPQTGKRLWWCQGQGDVSSPAWGAGLVYFDSGRGGFGCALEPSDAQDASTHIKWKARMPSGLGSPVIIDKYLYRLTDPGSVLRCFEASTGNKIYAEHLNGLFTTWASPIVDPRGRIFLATAGKSYVVQSGPTFKVLAVNDLGDGNHASPAVAAGQMILVGMKHVYCIGSKAHAATERGAK